MSRLRSVAENALAEAARAQEEASRLSAAVVQLQEEVESSQLQEELNLLRALDKLRAEHQQALEKEAYAREAERDRMDSWMRDLRQSHKMEKERLLEKIAGSHLLAIASLIATSILKLRRTVRATAASCSEMKVESLHWRMEPILMVNLPLVVLQRSHILNQQLLH